MADASYDLYICSKKGMKIILHIRDFFFKIGTTDSTRDVGRKEIHPN